jgi:hypothetical protein
MSAEDLLHWVAERGSGSNSMFDEAHQWAVRDVRRSSRSLRTMAELGQLEVSWSARLWSAVRPVVTLLPDAAGYGAVVGARSARLTQELMAYDDPDVYVSAVRQSAAPDALFVAAESARALERLGEAMGMAYVHSVTERLAAVLPTLPVMLDGLQTAPIASHYGIERYNLDRGWEPADRETGAGLYRYEVPGPQQLQHVDEAGRRYRVDLAVGAWAEAHRDGRTDMLFYRPDGLNGTLDAPGYLPLPSLHARAACQCSALAPDYDRGGILYRNVPRWLAEQIAKCLFQVLNEG